MGRAPFFTQQDNLAKKKRRLRLEQSGYVFGAHANEDAIRDKDKRVPKTKRMYREAVELWRDFTEEQGIYGYASAKGSKAPDYKTIKEFIRWYIHSTRGRLSENKRPVMKSVLSCAERLFGGFEEEMQISIVMQDRIEIFNWIQRSLTADGTIEKIESPNQSFTKKDFMRTICSLWQTDHRRFMPGLLKVTILLALQLYFFTGARIGAFIPAHEDKMERGLRYKDIELVLFPCSTAPWKVVWKVNQVWLKNNRNPNYTVFGIGIRDTKRPQFASGYILLALALEHGALFGIESVEDLAQYDLSDGPIPLRWNDDFLEKPVLRNVTADGPQDIPLAKDAFGKCLNAMLTAAGYTKKPKVHEIRKLLGKKIEGKHGSAAVSQIFGHKSAETYPKDYLQHCSSIDTVSAVLDEKEENEHTEWFQGFERFYESGLPGELPAEIEEEILKKPEISSIKNKIEQLVLEDADKANIQAERRVYHKSLIRQRLLELKQYQSRWVRERRDRRILNKGKYEPLESDKDICTRTQALIMPETARLAAVLSCDKELTFEEMLLFVQDLVVQCTRDFDVVYLPGEDPVDGVCPARECKIRMESLKKSERGIHIHECVRREIAIDLQVSESKILFCYECMKWFHISQWRDHCNSHLQSWTTQYCEVIVYRHTVTRPGYCPFCLWNGNLAAENRLHQWLTSGNLKQHIENEHMLGEQWQGTRPVCGCGQSFGDERGLRHHLHDTHKLNKATWVNPKGPRGKRKRHSIPADARVSSAEVEERSSKKSRLFSPRLHESGSLCDFIEKQPKRFRHPSTDSDSINDNRSDSSASYLSKETSPLCSQPTTPGAENLIDPKILEPLPIEEEQTRQSWKPLFLEDEISRAIPDGHELEDQQCRKSFIIPTMMHEVPLCRSSNEDENHEFSNNFTEDPRYSSHSDATGEPTDSAEIQDENQTITMADHDKPPKKLSAKERRKLRGFKDQHLTLKQAGLNFPDINKALLQEAWVEMDASQRRCTRSRAKLRQP